jgi:hypothetical protein
MWITERPGTHGTYRLVQRRRSRTRPPRRQERPWPIRHLDAASRRGPAASRSFSSKGFDEEEPPREPPPPSVVDTSKTRDEKYDSRLGYSGGQRLRREMTTDALAASGVSSYFADAERDGMSRACTAFEPTARPQPETPVRFTGTQDPATRVVPARPAPTGRQTRDVRPASMPTAQRSLWPARFSGRLRRRCRGWRRVR